MPEMTVSYNNADGHFRFDDAIREAMNRWPGEETDSGQDLETHMRHITYAFEDEGDDSLALVDLAEILGDDRIEEITYTGKPQVPTDTGSAQVPVDMGKPRMPTDTGKPQVPTNTGSPQVPTDACCVINVINLDQRKRSAHQIFYNYSRRLGWDFAKRADVLVNWFDEGMIEPLLQLIQDEGKTEDFEEFLADNFGDDSPQDAGSPDRRAS